MKVTKVQIREPGPLTRCLALADVTLDSLICIRDCKYTLEAVYFPSRRTLEGRWYPAIEVHDPELLFAIKTAVSQAYDAWLKDSVVSMDTMLQPRRYDGERVFTFDPAALKSPK